MNGGSIHICTSVEAGLAAELPYSQCQSASSLSSEPPLCQNEARVRRRLKTEADLNSANPSLFTELPYIKALSAPGTNCTTFTHFMGL